MAPGYHQRRLRLCDGFFVFTALASITQVEALTFGRNDFYNAINAREVRGVATPQEPAVWMPGFYPRSMHLGTSLPMESSWRYTGGGSGPNAGINLGLFRRQTTGNVEAYCNEGMHVCRDLKNQVGCCKNDSYCIIAVTGEGKCCPLGQICGEDPCKMSSTYCTKVMLVTATPTGTAATPEVTTTTSSGCCLRACALTMHLCDQKFGGYCCGNDAACIPNNICQATPNPNLPTSTVTKVTVTTEKCSTGSFECASAAGGGCCPNDMICTEVSNTQGCARSGAGITTRQVFSETPSGSAGGFITVKVTVTPSITGTGTSAASTGGIDDSSTNSSSSSSGLSAGAKAGIGIGAAVGALAAIALGAFAFIRYRKRKSEAVAIPELPSNQTAQYAGPGGVPGQYYPGTQYPQGYYPAPQGSPQMAPTQGFYNPEDAFKQQHASGQGAVGEEGGAVLLPNTVHTVPTAELPAQQ